MARTRHFTAAGPRPLRTLPAAALRAVLREGYSTKDLRSDVMAGLVVGIVALPLAMALSIAVGTPPQQGLYTAIVGGFLVAALGGSRTQVTGPTAAFIVILAPIFIRFGLAGLLMAGLLGGVILLAMGLLRMGKLIEFIPHPVTTGFTAGIATVIATLQLKDLFGLQVEKMPEHYFERVAALFEARGSASAWEFGIGIVTLAILVYLPRWSRRVPAPLVALPFAAVLALVIGVAFPDVEFATIASRFHYEAGGKLIHGIPQLPPMPIIPWLTAGANGERFVLDYATFRAILPGAFAVAMLGAIESLLSAVVADGMAGTKHDPDAELIALGVGNIVVPFFGGIAATGAIARTATNIRSGGKSPVSAMVHALTILAAVLVLAPLIGYLPMASLAALLLLVAWNMSEVKHFIHTVKVAAKSDVMVLIVCYSLTVAIDMVVAVSVGFMLAAVLFMRRMAEVSNVIMTEGEHPAHPNVPKGVVVYDINGPLFFGAAQKAMSTLHVIADRAKVVILRMEDVPAMDSTGLVAFESAVASLKKHGCVIIVCGLAAQPAQALRKAHFEEDPGRVLLVRDLATAVSLAEKFVGVVVTTHVA